MKYKGEPKVTDAVLRAQMKSKGLTNRVFISDNG